VATADGPVLAVCRDVSLPVRSGTYALLLRLERDCALTVGRLGRFRFPAGMYVYVGSARGPGGLSARVARHLRSPKPLRWHIDYLRPYARPVSAWFAEGDRRQECAWATVLTRLPGAVVPAPGFGASDCRCPAHLIALPVLPDPGILARAVGEPVVEKRLDG
jgi:Uri superfamily endonuclease